MNKCMNLTEWLRQNDVTSIADHEPSFKAGAAPRLLKVKAKKGLVPEEDPVIRPLCKIDLPQRSSDCPFRAALEATLSHIYIYSKAY